MGSLDKSDALLFAPADPGSGSPALEVALKLIDFGKALENTGDGFELRVEDEAAKEALSVVTSHSIGSLDSSESEHQAVAHKCLKNARPEVLVAEEAHLLKGCSKQSAARGSHYSTQNASSP